MFKISIRPIKLIELPRVLYITKLAYKVPFKKNTLITKSHEPKNIRESFLNKEFFVIAAIIKNKIIGSIRYKFVKNNNLYCYKLAVLKTFRNKGVGSSLINKLEKIAKIKKCRKILLDCAQEKKLPDYYKELGFKIDKVEKHLDHHDVYMSKSVK